MSSRHGIRTVSVRQRQTLIDLRRLLSISLVLPVMVLVGHSATAKNVPDHESWESYYLGGTKIGYGHRQVSTSTVDGRSCRQWTDEATMRIQRFGQQTQQQIKTVWNETADGEFVRFETRVQAGTAEIVTRGKPVANQLEITTTTIGGTSQTYKIAWEKDTGGFFAVEQSLERQPMQPGQRRTIRSLLPIFNTVAEIELTALDYEEADLRAVTQKLLKIQTVARLSDGNRLETVMWTDRDGRTQKSVMPGIEQAIYRTTRDDALDDAGYNGIDLGTDLLVKVKPPLDAPHRTRRVVYRVRLANEDPTRVFAAGLSQTVKSLGPHQAELMVRAIRPNQPAAVRDPSEPPVPEDSQANSLVQSDNKHVIALAQRVAPQETDPWRLAQALERTVHETITAKDFSQAFATAAEVAQTRQGDCTEHAVLLAALCRARGLPARVAIGLVYSAADQGFAYHMWNETWVHDRWIPLDATLGQGGIGAAHIKLTDSNLEGAGAYSTFLPVLKVMGQLELEIVEVQ